MKIELPGEQLAIGEEFLTSKGTFEENGIIYASKIGEKKVDKYSVGVQSKKNVSMIQKGDIVIGKINDTYDQIAPVKIEALENGKVINNAYAFIRISSVTNGYAKNFREYFRIGDIIKAEVFDITNLGIYLSTAKPGLGVIKTRCSRCKNEIGKTEAGFVCTNCRNIERRKV